MYTTKYKACIVDGCGKQSHGKAYCDKHLIEFKRGKKPVAVISDERKALMRSSCCGTVCTAGARHEYGEQYCKKCGQPCMWTT